MANKKLNAIITIGGALAGSFRTVIGSTTKELGKIGSQINKVRQNQRQLSDAIQTFGRMGRNVDNLRSRYSNLSSEISRLKNLQDKLTRSAERHSRIKDFSSKSALAGTAVGASGAGMLAAIRTPLDKAKHYQTEIVRIESLGLDKVAVARAEMYARDFKAFGNSQLEKIELMRDALSVFGGDEHHAEMAMPVLTKMNFSNKAVFGAESGAVRTKQLQDMLKVIELRGGTKTSKDFESEANWVQKVISSTGGRVQADEWRNVISTGGLAAKSMNADNFYKLLEPIIQEKGGHQTGTGLMSAYQALYQGRVTKRAANALNQYGLIGDPSKIKHDKAGQVSFMDPGALKGSAIYRQNPLEWIEKVMLPEFAKRGITSKDQILDAIGQTVSNRKGADFLATLYLQKDQIHKSMNLTDQSADIDTLNKKAQGTAAGQEEELLAKKSDALKALGTSVLPLYVKGLNLATAAFEKLNGFIERNPTLTKVFTVGFAALGVTLVTLGPLLIGGGGLIWGLGKFIQVGERASILFSSLTTNSKAFGSVIGALKNPIGLFKASFSGIGSIIRQIGFALIRTPWGAVAAIAIGAGLAIYKYWDFIKAFFVGVWTGITEALKPFTDGVSQIVEKTPLLKEGWELVSGAVSNAIDWFKNLLKPVNATEEQIGKATSAGESFGKLVGNAIGLILTPMKAVLDGFSWIINNAGKIGSLIDKATNFNIGDGLKNIFNRNSSNNAQSTTPPTLTPPKSIAAPPPIRSGQGKTTPQQINHITQSFTVNAAPGQSPEQIAQEVMRMQKQAQGVQQRSSMVDWGYAQ